MGMKRFLVWVMLLQFATGYNVLAELMRIPAFLEHYVEHQLETPGLSLAQFLQLHYSASTHAHSDDCHSKLPLHCMHGSISESVLPLRPEIVLVSHPVIEVVSPPHSFLHFLPHDFSCGLFRPPIA